MSKTNAVMINEVGEVVVCFIEGMGLIIGRPSGRAEISGESVTALNSPKVVQSTQQPNQPPMIRLADLIGLPERVYLTKDPILMYKVKDKQILALYVQATTGITLASKLP
jgi:hypothetical protein